MVASVAVSHPAALQGARASASKVFCAFLVVYPILNRYSAPIPQLTLSEFLLLGFFLHALLTKRLFGVRPVWAALVFSIYLILHSFLDAANLSGTFASDAIWSALRVAYLYAGIAMLTPLYFVGSIAKRYLSVAAVLIAIYGLLQTVFGFAGIVLTTYIPYLPIMGGDNLDIILETKMFHGLRFRCQSLLNEPAALCCYLLLPIVISLFQDKSKNPNYKLATFLTIAVLASASSTGIICVILAWLSHFAIRFWADGKNRGKLILVFVLFSVAGAAALAGSGLWDYFVQRTFGGTLSISGFSQSTRFYAIEDAMGASDTLYGVMFGEGLFQTANYLPGFFRLYLSLGLVGFLLMGALLVARLRKGTHETRACTVLFIVLNIGTEILLGNFALYYFAFIAGMEVEDGVAVEVPS